MISRRVVRRGLALGIALLSLNATATANPGFVHLQFASGGRQIRIDRYGASPASHQPKIIVLHGAGGTLLDGPTMRRMAESLAAAGNMVYLLHYFDCTGTLFGLDANMQRHFQTWLQTVKEGVAWVQRDGDEKAPVGVYGYSLGAFLALAAASNDEKIGAVVEQAGGMWNGNESLICKMAPVLVVHGELDNRVPLARYAAPLLRVLRERGGTVQSRIYPDEGHVFTAAGSARVREQAVTFFSHQFQGDNR